MYTTEIAHQWLRVSQERTNGDDFFRFIAAWISFNAFYARNAPARDESERTLVERFAQMEDSATWHKELLSGDHAYKAAVIFISNTSVTNLRSKKPFRVRNSDALPDVLSFVYTVRCNLFHGGKDPFGTRDRDLARAGHVIISKLVECALRT